MGLIPFLSPTTRVNFKIYLCRRYGGGMEIAMRKKAKTSEAADEMAMELFDFELYSSSEGHLKERSEEKGEERVEDKGKGRAEEKTKEKSRDKTKTYKQLCLEYMRREKIKYEDLRELVIKVTYKGDNLPSIPIFVYFEEQQKPIVSVKCWNIMNFSSHRELGVSVCNELNEKGRWAKFYVDQDADVIAELDAYIDKQDCGFTIMELVRRMVSIVDEAYPILMHALWE